jgi:hypothetical protein
MKRGVWVAGAAALVVAAGAGWYFASPAYAMGQLRDAAQAGDEDALEARIDFRQVRESLKEEMGARLAIELAETEDDNPFGAFGAALAMNMVGGMVDAVVTPSGMAAMIERGRLQRPGQVAAGAEADPVDWEIERNGFDTFRATPVGPPGEPNPTLLFERDGLGWDLVGIDLPDGGPGAPPA